MRHRVFWAFLIVTLAAALPATAQFSRVASPELVQTLKMIRQLGDGSFQQLVWWAPNPQDPGLTVPDWNNAEHQIVQLQRKDRDAVLSWLTGHGRAALYARGATDAMIGSRSARGTIGAFAASTPTPSPLSRYRVMQLTSPTLRGSAPPKSGINVLGGFALIAKDGTQAIVCLSFTNLAAVPANAIHFAFPLMSADGETLGTVDFNRTGLFSPNIVINGPSTADAYFNPGLSSRGVFNNCVTSNQGTAALPLLHTRYVAYKVAGVTYTDGSSWP